MARIISPSTAEEIKKLVVAIKAKNTALGDDSPLPLLLTENEIDLAADLVAATTAETLNNAATSLARSAENLTETRDLKSGPAMQSIAGIAQLLKKFYKTKPTELGNWGLSITASGKITYPVSPADREQMITEMQTKYNSFAADSNPLTAYLTRESISIPALVTALSAARVYDNQAKTATAEAENDTEQRNTLLAPVLKHISVIGGFLMDFYKGNPRALGLWGFVVDESTSKPAEQTTKIIAGDKKTITGVLLGGTFTNLGPGDAHVYKGKTTTGNPLILAAGGKMGIQKGWSTITVSNPSTLNALSVKVLRSK